MELDDMHNDGVICSSNHLWDEKGLKAEGESGLPVKFRIINNDALSFSASGTFTKQQCHNAFYKIKSVNPQVKQIYVIDLIKETHGFIRYGENAVPFTIRSPSNKVNYKIPDHLVEDDERRIISKLNVKLTQDVKLISRFSTKEGNIDEIYQTIQIRNGNSFKSEKEIIKTITSEDVIFKYIRLPSIDHQPISSHTIINLVYFVQNQFNPETDWLHIHCHGGKGRSTSISLIFDMLQRFENSTLNKISFEGLIKFQKDSGGKNLAPKDIISTWKKDNVEMRYNSLENVYSLLKKIEEYGLKPIYSVALELCFFHGKLTPEKIYKAVQKCNTNVSMIFHSNKDFFAAKLIALHNAQHSLCEANCDWHTEDEDEDDSEESTLVYNDALFIDEM